jgi:hypothetical protein
LDRGVIGGVGEEEVVQGGHEGAVFDGMTSGRGLEPEEACELGDCDGSMNLQGKRMRI